MHVGLKALTAMLVEHTCSKFYKEVNRLIPFIIFHSEVMSSTFAHSQMERLIT